LLFILYHFNILKNSLSFLAPSLPKLNSEVSKKFPKADAKLRTYFFRSKFFSNFFSKLFSSDLQITLLSIQTRRSSRKRVQRYALFSQPQYIAQKKCQKFNANVFFSDQLGVNSEELYIKYNQLLTPNCSLLTKQKMGRSVWNTPPY